MLGGSGSPSLSRRGFLTLGSALLLTSTRGLAAEPSDPALLRLAASCKPRLDELERWVKSVGGSLHVALADISTGQELAGIDSGTVENPASNQKLVTAAAALHYLGGTFTYSTGLYGNLEGTRVARLVIRGDGDPSFSSSALENMVQNLVARGVRVVDEVLVDQSAFDDAYVPPAFAQQPGEWAAFRAPVCAVAIDGNAVTFCVQPTKRGQPAKVWFEPAGFVEIEGDVSTVADKKAAPALTLKGRGQKLLARVAGSIGEGAANERWRQRVEDPRYYAGYVLKRLLEQRGVTVSGGVALGGQNEQSELALHRSAPVAELLHQLGKKSDNFYAEMLLKAVGMKAKGRPAHSADGAEAAAALLKQIGAWDAGARITNGSGLYDANRISARSLTRVLAYAYQEPRLSADYLAQLPIGGVDGTLAARFYGLRAQRSVLAKTGTLRRIVSLSGYVFGPNRTTPVAFSFIVADVIGRQPEVRRRIDKIVEAMARDLWGKSTPAPAATAAR